MNDLVNRLRGIYLGKPMIEPVSIDIEAANRIEELEEALQFVLWRANTLEQATGAAMKALSLSKLGSV